MTDSQYAFLAVERQGFILYIRLNRPEVHNALSAELIGELRECFSTVPSGGDIRVVVLSGEGRSFCAGADLNYMREVAGYGHEENVRDAGHLADMLHAINSCPVPTLARVHGAALGGGAGIVACCDVAVAADDARFGFTEAKLGILPAVISPFVVAKMGPGHARALFTTGERFGAHRALLTGLVHHAVPTAELDSTIERLVRELYTSAPGAASEAKTLVENVAGKPPAEVRGYTAQTIARLRAGAEGREGMSAFLEKRKPAWAEDPA